MKIIFAAVFLIQVLRKNIPDVDQVSLVATLRDTIFSLEGCTIDDAHPASQYAFLLRGFLVKAGAMSENYTDPSSPTHNLAMDKQSTADASFPSGTLGQQDAHSIYLEDSNIMGPEDLSYSAHVNNQDKAGLARQRYNYNTG